jgi:hypothetical protein
MALGDGSVSPAYLNRHLLGDGIDLDRIRADRVLYEALYSRADPLHPTLVFGLSHTMASRSARAVEKLLDDQLEPEPITASGSRNGMGSY